MKFVYTELLPDDELRAHLKRGDSIIFKGPRVRWTEIEVQVERMGFGDEYAVSRTGRTAEAGQEIVTRVSPIHPA